jgi:hypothetical protein
MENKKQVIENAAKQLKMQKGETLYALQIAGMVFFAFLIFVPVYFAVQRAGNVEDFLTPEQLASFSDPDAVVPQGFERGISSGEIGAGLERGPRSARYSNIGSAIVSVSLENFARLSAQDYLKVGQTPWSLMNTVGNNMNVPSVAELVFNNANVVQGFLQRVTTREFLDNPQKLPDMIKNNDYIIEQFLTNPIVLDALENPAMIEALGGSVLYKEILNSAVAHGLMANPQAAIELIKSNKFTAPLLENKALIAFLKKNPQTAKAAAAL